MHIEEIKADYQDNLGRAERLKNAVIEQFGELLDKQKISLGVPMESRVKSWVSITEKIQRKALKLKNISQLDDFIGVRAILLFKADIKKVDTLIRENFEIVNSEDAGDRLTEMQFGYQSRHYIIRLPQVWLSIPSMAVLGSMRVEIQVRTLAQHMWAAASHKLQYKTETSVPPPLRRAIHRVSALLEVIDLEFDRLLVERESYKENNISKVPKSDALNVDTLAALLDEILPAANKSDNELYADLLKNLIALGVKSVGALREMLVRHKKLLALKDVQMFNHMSEVGYEKEPDMERIKNKVFLTHVGLVRIALYEEFGDDLVDKAFGEPE